MRKLSLAATALAGALVVAACKEATEPEASAAKPTLQGLITPDHPAFLAYLEARSRTTRGMSSLAVPGRDTECAGIVEGTFGDLVVPPDGFCFIQNSSVLGNIRAMEGAVLAVHGSTVQGDIRGHKTEAVQLCVNVIGGDIRIQRGGASPNFIEVLIGGINSTLTQGSISIRKVTGEIAIGITGCGGSNTLHQGSIRIEDNTIVNQFVDGLQVSVNDVAGDLRVARNNGAGTKVVQNNTVGGRLQCFRNELPFIGGPNTAATAEGQCF